MTVVNDRPISEAQTQVMQVRWGRHPRMADEVVAALASSTDWADPTVKTLLNRLLNQGAIEATREGRRYLYSPVQARQAWVAQKSEGLLQRLFEGSVAPLVAHFRERGRLSEDEVAELHEQREQNDDEDGGPVPLGA